MGFELTRHDRKPLSLCIFNAALPPMLTLCCTQKVRERLRLAPELPPPGPSTTALGNWYVNLVRYGRQQVILATSERSLLTLIFPAKDLRDSLELNIQVGLRSLLNALDVPRSAIDRELGEMQFFMYGKASNRRVLGSMNEFAFMLGHYLQESGDPLALALRLADTPMKAFESGGKRKGFGVPNEVAVELLTSRQGPVVSAH